VVDAEPEGHLRLSVRFADGLAGHVRFLPEHLTGVFEALKDPEFFQKVFVDGGAVAWPGQIDLAPDAMYQAVRAQGEWVLS
jgi:hypothetical protein